MNTPELRKQVEEIKWRHQIDLNNGIITPGEIDTSAGLKKIHMGINLVGKSVSKYSAPLIKIPASAPFPTPTISAAGVAK